MLAAWLVACALALRSCRAFEVPQARLQRSRSTSNWQSPLAGPQLAIQERRRRRQTVIGAAVVSPLAVQAATGAVARLLTLCALGACYAKAGVLDKAACATLSRLIYNIFQPAMLFTSCARTIATAEAPLSLVALPACAAAQIFFGLAFGSAALATLGPNRRRLGGKKDTVERRRFLASTEARELRALCAFGNAGPLPFVFAQSFFRDDPVALGNAVAYISFYLVGWSPLFWTIGPAMLRSKKRIVETNNLSSSSSESSSSSLVVLSRRFLAFWRRVLSPPVMASFLGVICGACAPLHGLVLRGPLADGLRLLGSAYLPAVALVLAGTLARSAMADPNALDADLQQKTISLPLRLGLLALCRFVALPLASLALLNLPFQTPLDNDPLLRFVVFMASAMPSAQNAIVILQLDKDGSEAAAPSMAKVLALLYIVAIFPMAILLSIAAQLAPLHLVSAS